MTRFEYPALDETLYRQTLSNGLQVMVLPRKNFSRKIAYFVTDYGAIHTHFSFEGKEHRVPDGIAHFLEHKIFDMPGDRDVSGEFAARGAQVNAFTSYDMTAYYFSCTDHFDECLRLLLEFVSTPCFTQESVQKEWGIIDQEIFMNEDSPDTMVYENLMFSAYAEHPIRTPILGTPESIREITPETLELCHRAFYTPGNMVLCVVGDVEPDLVEQTALEVLGEKPREVGQKIRDWSEPLTCPREEISMEMEVAMPIFALVFKCPPVPGGEEGFRQELIADMAAEVLFGETSELYLRLYEEGIIDSSFGGGFEVLDGCAMFIISGDSEEPLTVREALLSYAKHVIARGIPEGDFRRMHRSAMGSRIKNLDSFDATCFRLCAYRISDFDYFQFHKFFHQIRQEEVLAFLEKVITPENCCLSTLYPPLREELP